MRLAGTFLCLLSAGSSVFYLGELFSWWGGAFYEQVLLRSFIARYIIYMIPFMLFPQGLKLRRAGRRHLVRIISSPEALDGTGSFVLYLRSFDDDSPLSNSPWQKLSIPFLFQQFLISGRSEEEQLTAAFKRVGPLVAAGLPGERLPYGGARRLYIPPEDWQRPILELMLKARLVVIALGQSDGVVWELVEAMYRLPPERLVLLVPMGEDEYNQLRERVENELRAKAEHVLRATGRIWTPPTLPDYRQHGYAHTIIEGAIWFSPRWTPAFVDFSRPGRLMGAFGEFYDRLLWSAHVGLRPVLLQLEAYEQWSVRVAERETVADRRRTVATAPSWMVGSRGRAMRLACQRGYGPYVRSKRVSVPDGATATWIVIAFGSFSWVTGFIPWWIPAVLLVPAAVYDLLGFGRGHWPGYHPGLKFKAHFFADGVIIDQSTRPTTYSWTEIKVVVIGETGDVRPAIELYRGDRLLVTIYDFAAKDLGNIARHGGASYAEITEGHPNSDRSELS